MSFPQDVLECFDAWAGGRDKKAKCADDWDEKCCDDKWHGKPSCPPKPKPCKPKCDEWDDGETLECCDEEPCEPKSPCDGPKSHCDGPKPPCDDCWRECCFQIVAKSIDWCSAKDCPIATFAVKQRFAGLIGHADCLAQTKRGPMCRKEKVLISSCGLFSLNIPQHTTVLSITLCLEVPKSGKTQLAKLKGLFIK
jgi:hypothetical protein